MNAHRRLESLRRAFTDIRCAMPNPPRRRPPLFTLRHYLVIVASTVVGTAWGMVLFDGKGALTGMFAGALIGILVAVSLLPMT